MGSHYAKYNQMMGVVVSIDGINNILSTAKEAKDALYIVLFTICPPSTFYEKDYRITDNVYMTNKWDWKSLTKNPRFVFDKLQIFKDSDFEYNQEAILLCDIREIRFKTDDGVNIADLQILKYGFSFF